MPKRKSKPGLLTPGTSPEGSGSLPTFKVFLSQRSVFSELCVIGALDLQLSPISRPKLGISQDRPPRSAPPTTRRGMLRDSGK